MMGLEDDPFLLGPGIFSAFAVSFREIIETSVFTTRGLKTIHQAYTLSTQRRLLTTVWWNWSNYCHHIWALRLHGKDKNLRENCPSCPVRGPLRGNWAPPPEIEKKKGEVFKVQSTRGWKCQPWLCRWYTQQGCSSMGQQFSLAPGV